MSVVIFYSEKIIPKFVCSMVKFSMPSIFHRSLHLASQIMYFMVSYLFEILRKKTPKYVVMVSLQAVLLRKDVWYNYLKQ